MVVRDVVSLSCCVLDVKEAGPVGSGGGAEAEVDIEEGGVGTVVMVHVLCRTLGEVVLSRYAEGCEAFRSDSLMGRTFTSGRHHSNNRQGGSKIWDGLPPRKSRGI